MKAGNKKINSYHVSGLPSVHPLPKFDFENASVAEISKYIGEVKFSKRLLTVFMKVLEARPELRKELEQYIKRNKQ